MQIIRWIIALIIITYIRIWFVNNFATKKQYNKKLLIPIGILSTVSVMVLYFYPQLLNLADLSILYFAENPTISTISMFLLYVALFLVMIVSLQNKKLQNPILKYIFAISIFFLALSLWWLFAGINFMILYLVLWVFSEELIKITISKSTQNKHKQLDLIFVSLLIALFFSLVETFFYVILQTWSSLDILWLTISRWIFTSALHIVSTLIIAYSLQKTSSTKTINYFSIIKAFSAWFVFHFLYNISIQYNITTLTIILLISWYFILSYLLFKSDSIFLELKAT